MSYEKKVKDLMISLEDYPHVPYWFSLEQAAVMAREAAIKFEGTFEPRAMLVFGEKYQLLGVLTQRDIVSGLQADLLRQAETVKATLTWADLIGPSLKERAQKPVSEVMSPIKVTVTADAPLATALALMIQEDLERIPVLDNDRVVGMLRMSDLFKEISEALLAGEPP